jgi:multidrug efflux pump subunit AcrA (membrane-fusion protein)
MKLVSTLVAVFAVSALSAQTVELVKVQSKRLERITRLPAEILPYQKVALHARVTGFVEKVAVDRGSPVKTGQALAVLAAPEMAAQVAEAEAKAQAVEA